MREIKFRAWVGTRKLMFQVREMIIPDGLNESGFQEIAATDNYSIVRPMHYIQPILMQYTGLKDKNGKEIYEGDIVRVVEPDEDSCCGNEFVYICEVCFGGGEYKASFTINSELFWKNYALLYNERHTREVIGNIYENGDLLNGK